MNRPGLGFRLESMIAFQDHKDPFIEKYYKLIGQVKDKMNAGYYDFEVDRDPITKAIQDLINERFNMTVNLRTNEMTAAIVPFFANDSNILMNELFRRDGWLASENELMKSKPKLQGWVDLQAAKLGGDFAKGKSTLYMNYNKLLGDVITGGYNLKYRGVIAVTLHEIGHTFYPLVFANRLDKSNLILEQEFNSAQKENGAMDERKRLTRVFEQLGRADAAKIAEDLCSDNPAVLSKAMIKIVGETTLQHQVNAKYTNTNFEMLADNFATRFGLGPDLVEALEKMTPGGVRFGDLFRAIHETIHIMNHVMKIILTIMKIMKGKSLFGSIVTNLLLFLLTSVGTIVFFYVLVRMSGESSRDYTYDDLVVRYQRIRAQIISDIKARKLTKNDAKRAIESLDMIGNLIKQGLNWRTPLDHLFNTLNPADRRAKDSIGRQQALEALVNNDLFVASLKLQHLAG